MADLHNVKLVSVSELRAQFAELLGAMVEGETLVVTRYGAGRVVGARGARRRRADFV